MKTSVPKGLTIASLSLVLAILTGCGSAPFTGSLTDGSGNGSGPTAPAGQATISSLSPATIAAGSPTLTVTATGTNFLRSTTILWNTTTLTTTYISSTQLQAQVPASLITRPTTVTLIPTPQVTLNFGATFTVTIPPLTGNPIYALSMLPVEANDMVLDPATQQIYLSIASFNPTNPNTITLLDPQTAKLGTSALTTSEPSRLAISSDGAFIYAGLNKSASVQRLTLPALQPDISIPLGSGTYEPYFAIDVETDPISSHSVAVVRGEQGYSPTELGGILIYDDAVARPQAVPGFSPGPGPIDSIVWNSNGQALYGIDTEGTGTGLYVMSVTQSGVQLVTNTETPGSTFGNNLHFDSTTGYLYSDSGVAIDPATNTLVGTFPLNTIQGGPGTFVMVPDGKLNIAYFVGQTSDEGGTNNYVIEAYDLTHFTFLGAMPLTIASTSTPPTKIIRWGTDGLAFLTGDPSRASSPAAGDGVYLVTGAFVTSPAP